ncbi:MAG: peptidoglycan DD-metalloendopeptidase family protein [Gammaproteobacteria bacterium]|nr:peptidase M23 [Gammaproteobacteria bacterium]
MPAAFRGCVRACLVALAATLLVACGSTPAQRPTTYVVKRGDTLYSIARRHGLDYRDIARWNGIGPDYLIYPGQRLKLYPSNKSSAAAAAAQTRSGSAPRSSGQSSSPRAVPSTAALPRMRWQWPVSGGTATLTSRPNGGYGLTISGKLGDEVRAAADGRVVYTGSGLLGYGQLIIVKHNETFLSAYGHTQSVFVREGDFVKAGQRVATMGTGPRGTPVLYFEIRVNGTPHNPLELLPRR